MEFTNYQVGTIGTTPYLKVTIEDRKNFQKYLSELSRNAKNLLTWQKETLLVVECTESGLSYKIPLRDNAEIPNEPEALGVSLELAPNVNPLTLKPDSDHETLMMWLLERRAEGRSTCVTSQIDDKCLFQNDKLPVKRTVLTASEFIGQNYRWFWRDTMEDYNELRKRLDNLQGERDYLAGFEYCLRRPDGKMCRYSTDYYLATFIGVPVRIGVSSPDDWELLE